MTDPGSGDGVGGGGGGGERAEIGELMSGLDPPRSLPESLRRRLEHELSAGAPARPLEPELDERLAAALESREDQDMAMLLSGLDGPRPLPAEVSARLQQRLLGEPAPEPGRIRALVRAATRSQIGAGVAAACLLVAAVTGLALTHHNPSGPAATKSPSASATSGAGSSSDAVGGGVSASNGATAGAGGQAVPQAANSSAAANGATALGSSTGSGSAAAATGSAPSSFAPSATPASASTTARSVAPQVSVVAPAAGSPAGGTTVTIRGLNFEGATAVHFGTMAALNFVVRANGQITAITPPHLPGIVNVTVTTAHGTSAINKNDQFDYSA